MPLLNALMQAVLSISISKAYTAFTLTAPFMNISGNLLKHYYMTSLKLCYWFH